MKKFSGLGVVKFLVYLIFIMFLIIPLLSIFMVSFTDEPVNFFESFVNIDIMKNTISLVSNSTLDNFKEILTNKSYFKALKNSLVLSITVSVLVLILCVPMAYGIARTKMPFKRTISALCAIPLVIPTFISGYAFIIMFGRSGWATYLYNALGG